MYAVLPFTIFVAPPLIGFLADKLGSYTKVEKKATANEKIPMFPIFSK
jgi:hypothetical protein